MSETCPTGKVAYQTPQAAQRVVEFMRRDRSKSRRARCAESYRCEQCGAWHLTHRRWR